MVSDQVEKEEEENKGIFGRAKDRVKDRINQTEAAKNFKESDLNKEIDKLRTEYKEFKGILKE